MPTHLSSLVLALTLHASTPIADAPDRLITSQGVDIRIDERVFALFAALNGLGFAEETERKGPPLRAPEFHPMRVQVRDAMRKADDAGQLAGVRQLFDEHPAEIEVYLQALLAGDGLSPEAQKVAAALGVLDTFRQRAEVAKLFDKMALDQRGWAKELKSKLEKDFAEGAKLVGGKELRAPGTLVVLPNPLDGHDIVRVVRAKDSTYVIPGPGLATAERAVLEASLRARLASAVDAAWGTPGGAKLAKSWDGVKASPRIARGWSDGKAYLTDTLARLFTYKIQSKVAGTAGKRELEDDHLDGLTQADLRWARPLMRALDGYEGGEPIEAALPKILAKAAI